MLRPASSAVGRMRECRYGSVQGLELLVTVLLARNRQPPPAVAAGVPHANIAAELVSLPSGLLAKVCEAIVKLKVRPGAGCVRARACGLHGRWERAVEVRTGAHCPVRVGQGQSAPQGMTRPHAECWKYYS
jgi:hypothetical protein